MGADVHRRVIRERGREERRRGIDKAAHAWPRAGDAVGIGGQWNGEEAKRRPPDEQLAFPSFARPIGALGTAIGGHLAENNGGGRRGMMGG